MPYDHNFRGASGVKLVHKVRRGRARARARELAAIEVEARRRRARVVILDADGSEPALGRALAWLFRAAAPALVAALTVIAITMAG